MALVLNGTWNVPIVMPHGKTFLELRNAQHIIDDKTQQQIRPSSLWQMPLPARQDILPEGRLLLIQCSRPYTSRSDFHRIFCACRLLATGDHVKEGLCALM
jgi:hypothetical protein